MEIIDLLNYNENRFDTAIALGNFDGIHIGHQELIRTMVKKAKELKIKSSVLLFKNHTKTIVDGNKLGIITNNEQKFKILEELDVDIVYLLDFNEDIMKLSGERFIKEIIVDKMNGKLIVVGFDYRFGHKATGNSEYLRELGKSYGIEVNILNPILKNENIVSSSSIRDLITKGNMREVLSILGRPYSIIGKVIHGKNRGNKLGFPTANIETLDNYAIPKNGVYITNTMIDNERYLSATNIGYNPTFNEDILKIETFILNFDKNIYGEILEIEFLDFLRDDIKFSSKEELIKQMELDIKMIKSKH